MQKYTIILITLIIAMSACQKSTTEEKPETLEEKKAFLSQKQAELEDLRVLIEELQDEIVELSPELQEKAILVDTLLVHPEDFSRYINIQGSVVADETVNVVSEAAGRILTLTAGEGDYIKKDELIATIDMEIVDKQVQEVETSLSLARDVYERQERLWNQNIGSEVQYLQAKNNVEKLEKALETLAFQKSKSNIYSPISGVVDREILNQGEVTSPGMPILTILNTYKLKVVADLPERYIRVAHKGQTVQVYFPSLDESIPARITMLGRSIDPANRTLKIELTPLKRHSLIKPNLLAELQLVEFTQKSVIAVPSEIVIQQVDGQEFVYTVQKDDQGDYRAHKTMVTPGESADGRVIISDGLQSGQIVVTRGARSISENGLIQLSNEENHE